MQSKFSNHLFIQQEYGSIIWGHAVYTQIGIIDFWNNLKEDKSALMLIFLRAMKSTPIEALESERNIVPIDLAAMKGSRDEPNRLVC